MDNQRPRPALPVWARWALIGIAMSCVVVFGTLLVLTAVRGAWQITAVIAPFLALSVVLTWLRLTRSEYVSFVAVALAIVGVKRLPPPKDR